MRPCKLPPTRTAFAAQPRPIALRSSAPHAAVSTSLSPSSVQAVDAAVLQLIDAATKAEPLFASHWRVEGSKVAAAVENLGQVAAAHGAKRVDAAISDGSFRSRMTTDLRQVELDSSTTFGRLSFNKYQPKDLRVQQYKVEQVKGDFEGSKSAYVVIAYFKIVDAPSSGGDDLQAAAAGLVGMSSSIGVYELPTDPEHPERLVVAFTKMRLQPADPAQLPQWLAALAPHNPTMRPTDGVIEFELNPPPKGHLDYLAMTPDWHVSWGNLNSIVVMQRVPGA